MLAQILSVTTGEPLGPHEDGEIVFRTPSSLRGYYKNPKATAGFLDDDGWCHSGNSFAFSIDECRSSSLFKQKRFAPKIIIRHPKYSRKVPRSVEIYYWRRLELVKFTIQIMEPCKITARSTREICVVAHTRAVNRGGMLSTALSERAHMTHPTIFKVERSPGGSDGRCCERAPEKNRPESEQHAELTSRKCERTATRTLQIESSYS